MNPIEQAIALVNSIIAKLNSAPSSDAGSGPVTDLALAETYALLQQEINAAFQADLDAFRRYAAPFLLIPGAVAVLAAMESSARVYQQSLIGALESQVKAVTELEREMSTALGHLAARREAWKAISEALKDVPDAVAALKRVPGWEGAASDKYGTAAADQVTAASSLSAAAMHMPSTIDDVEVGNRTVASELRREIECQRRSISGTDGPAWGFSRTRAVRPALAQIGEKIGHAVSGQAAAGFAARINEEAGRALASLPAAWPITGN